MHKLRDNGGETRVFLKGKQKTSVARTCSSRSTVLYSGLRRGESPDFRRGDREQRLRPGFRTARRANGNTHYTETQGLCIALIFQMQRFFAPFTLSGQSEILPFAQNESEAL